MAIEKGFDTFNIYPGKESIKGKGGKKGKLDAYPTAVIDMFCVNELSSKQPSNKDCTKVSSKKPIVFQKKNPLKKYEKQYYP